MRSSDLPCGRGESLIPTRCLDPTPGNASTWPIFWKATPLSLHTSMVRGGLLLRPMRIRGVIGYANQLRLAAYLWRAAVAELATAQERIGRGTSDRERHFRGRLARRRSLWRPSTIDPSLR